MVMRLFMRSNIILFLAISIVIGLILLIKGYLVYRKDLHLEVPPVDDGFLITKN